MALVLASAEISDDEFLERVRTGQLDPSQFRHADHLRLAWLWLHRASKEEAERQVCSAIQNFAAHHGVPHLYHETITLAWIRLLATHHEPTFAEFLHRNEFRLNKHLLHRFWTPELLASDLAKRQWIAPDLGWPGHR